MAFLGVDDKQNTGQQPQQGGAPGMPGSSLVSGAGTTPLVGSGSANVNASAPTATQNPIGAGGSGGWTNIQDYLTANQGNTGSSDTLSKNLTSAFSQDKIAIDQGAQSYEQQAQQAGQSNYLAPDQASQMLQQASGMYQYGPQQQQGYTDLTNQLRNTYNSTYAGPQQGAYNPVLSANTQQYGQALGNDSQLDALMNQFYAQQQGGTQLTQGQSDLQNLLQANDPLFQQTRQNLSNQYNNFAPQIQQDTNAVNQAIQQAQQQFQGNHDQLYGYLTGQQSGAKSALDQAVSNWNAAYQGPNSQAQALANSELNQILGYSQQGDSRSPYNSVEMLWSQDPSYGAAHPGFAKNAPTSIYRNPDLGSYINSGSAANEFNVAGQAANRNMYNTVQDILQNGNVIGYDPNAPKAVTADYQKFINDLLAGANNTLAGDRNSGYTNLANSYDPVMNRFNSNIAAWSPQAAAAQQNMLNAAAQGSIESAVPGRIGLGPQIRPGNTPIFSR